MRSTGKDHLPPHFHAKYGGDEGMVDIYTGRVIRGSLSVRVVSLVNEWRVMHIEELTANWERARQRLSLNYIAPLE